ncbi:MAG: DUF2288 domain-containing protein [Proteobacteria bacterium]|nr:DUF2288 domain-containing protein [Pseudomonadota bacterium]
MAKEHQLDELERHKLNLETGILAWRELERHFASGRLISVSPRLDLVDVAMQFAKDNKSKLELWLASNDVYPVTDAQASTWHSEQAMLWAVVVKPWVLVQIRQR